MSSLINLYGESACRATLGLGGKGAVWRGQVTQRQQFGFKEILVVPNIAGEGRYVQGKDLSL